MAPAYAIAVVDIHDQAGYDVYRRLARPSLERHGFERIASDPHPIALEGSVFGSRTSIVRFPSSTAALAWYDDPEYRAAKQVREESAASHFVIAEGLDPAPTIGEAPGSAGATPGYTLTLIDVHDPDQYKAYARLAFPIMARYGTRVLVDDKHPRALEGDIFRSRLILLEWASKEAALAWYADPDYVAATRIRLAATDSRLVALDGRPPNV
jgi:uncharacterized protein (DUF1330 family)